MLGMHLEVAKWVVTTAQLVATRFQQRHQVYPEDIGRRDCAIEEKSRDPLSHWSTSLINSLKSWEYLTSKWSRTSLTKQILGGAILQGAELYPYHCDISWKYMVFVHPSHNWNPYDANTYQWINDHPPMRVYNSTSDHGAYKFGTPKWQPSWFTAYLG